jgi:predicted phosphodiesterase
MKPLLLTSDLHFIPKYFRWLEEHAGEYQAIVIAGDLCEVMIATEVITDEVLIERGRARDISAPISIRLQRQKVESWLAQIGVKVPVVVSSGNHDCGVWRPALSQGVQGDFSVCETESFILATIPWLDNDVNRLHAPFSATEDNLKSAQALARKTHKPLFFVGHEIATFETLNGKHALGLLKQFHPAFFGCGHRHQVPYFSGWCSREEGTACFNAGNHEAITGDEFSAPNHILIFPPDAQGEARVEWHHLVLDDKKNFAWEIATTSVSITPA